MSTELVLVTADDWQALYVNGKRVDEGHHISFRDVMAVLENAPGPVTRWAQVEVDWDWMNGRSDLPETLGECELQEPVPCGLILE